MEIFENPTLFFCLLYKFENQFYYKELSMEIVERVNHTGVRGMGRELIFQFFFSSQEVKEQVNTQVER